MSDKRAPHLALDAEARCEPRSDPPSSGSTLAGAREPPRHASPVCPTALTSRPIRWVSVAVAAEFLGLPPRSLRRSLERVCMRVADGGIEALVDGVRGRKFGHLWRVQFCESWLVARTPS